MGRLLKQGLLELRKITMLQKMKMLAQPLCLLSHLSHHHLQHMTQATWQTGSYSGIEISPGAPANTPAEVPHSTGITSNAFQPSPQSVPAIPAIDPDLYTASQGDIRLTPEDFARAQKYCKCAGSALQYEYVGTAVQNLQKALRLLTTGRE